MLDMKAIDGRIRKLQKLKEVLADEGMRELIADPELLELMRGAVATNGRGLKQDAGVVITENLDSELPAEGSLKRKVLDAARAWPGKFSTRDIIDSLERAGHHFERDSALAVNQALRVLTEKNKLIRMVRRGSGRIPNIYEAVRKDTTQKN